MKKIVEEDFSSLVDKDKGMETGNALLMCPFMFPRLG